jgi:hypothetical protein
MDGKFKLVLVRDIDVKSRLKSALASIDEKYIDTESTEMIVTDYAEIEFEEPRLLQLDDEVIGKSK